MVHTALMAPALELPRQEAVYDVAGKAGAQHAANMLAMGGGLIGNNMADKILDAFLNTPFEGGRHQRRVDKLEG